jgi:hypothetical protein
MRVRGIVPDRPSLLAASESKESWRGGVIKLIQKCHDPKVNPARQVKVLLQPAGICRGMYALIAPPPRQRKSMVLNVG